MAEPYLFEDGQYRRDMRQQKEKRGRGERAAGAWRREEASFVRGVANTFETLWHSLNLLRKFHLTV